MFRGNKIIFKLNSYSITSSQNLLMHFITKANSSGQSASEMQGMRPMLENRKVTKR